ncbi:hypothetical protein Glove_126g12 [Diversispora epigaea]|uniref:Protein kinase domain-containing protein n=1 Tax=Diversispora epigaea TaxID=1348612 RepID=A0A397J288_9GLOM|nr:hypothetical protein Glove_126g12 [Diversispora epigaea]
MPTKILQKNNDICISHVTQDVHDVQKPNDSSTFNFLVDRDVVIKPTEFPDTNVVRSNIESFDMTLKDTRSFLNQKENKKNERQSDILFEISGDNTMPGQKNQKDVHVVAKPNDSNTLNTFHFLADSDVNIKPAESPGTNAVQNNIESFGMTLKDTRLSLNQKENKKNERQNNFAQYARDIVSKISGDNTTRQKNIKNGSPMSKVLKFGTCNYCKAVKSNSDWCLECERKNIADSIADSTGEWTSNNPKLDEYIRQTQLNPLNTYDYFEWIQFDKIIDQRFVTKGGFGQVYEGTWIDGPRHFAKDASRQDWKRKENEHVALKTIKVQTEEEGFDKFLSELKAHRSFIGEPVSHLMRCYGITQDPNKPDTYTLVMPWAKDGDLSVYLKKRKYDPDFKIIKRIKMLYGISSGLSRIHNKKMIHQDLHSKNILIDDTDLNSPAISDLAFCNIHNDQVFGVWQYIAPECINNKQYTEASDIYSFGIIMCEMMSCEKPFNKFEEDKSICVMINDLKPEYPKWTPKSYVELMLKCLDKDPSKRPSVSKLYSNFKGFIETYYDNENNEFVVAENQRKENLMKNKLQVNRKLKEPELSGNDTFISISPCLDVETEYPNSQRHDDTNISDYQRAYQSIVL